jgi:hypothetical protein
MWTAAFVVGHARRILNIIIYAQEKRRIALIII